MILSSLALTLGLSALAAAAPTPSNSTLSTTDFPTIDLGYAIHQAISYNVPSPFQPLPPSVFRTANIIIRNPTTPTPSPTFVSPLPPLAPSVLPLPRPHWRIALRSKTAALEAPVLKVNPPTPAATSRKRLGSARTACSLTSLCHERSSKGRLRTYQCLCGK